MSPVYEKPCLLYELNLNKNICYHFCQIPNPQLHSKMTRGE